jgi:hypothetical protein
MSVMNITTKAIACNFFNTALPTRDLQKMLALQTNADVVLSHSGYNGYNTHLLIFKKRLNHIKIEQITKSINSIIRQQQEYDLSNPADSLESYINVINPMDHDDDKDFNRFFETRKSKKHGLYFLELGIYKFIKNDRMESDSDTADSNHYRSFTSKHDSRSTLLIMFKFENKIKKRIKEYYKQMEEYEESKLVQHGSSISDDIQPGTSNLKEDTSPFIIANDQNKERIDSICKEDQTKTEVNKSNISQPTRIQAKGKIYEPQQVKMAIEPQTTIIPSSTITKGGVYFAWSDCLNCTKIGATLRKTPYPRLSELSRGVTKPFKLTAWIPTPNPFGLESKIHRHFTAKRIRNTGAGTEFFNLSEVETAAYIEQNWTMHSKFPWEV